MLVVIRLALKSRDEEQEKAERFFGLPCKEIRRGVGLYASTQRPAPLDKE